MLPRFFAPDAARHAGLIELSEDETTHLTKVLRLKPGAAVQLFDGRGAEWRGEFVHVMRKRAAVRLLERVAAAPEPQIPITLAIAVLKSDKMHDVVRDAVMLGVASIQPLLTDRAETSAAAVSRARRVDRWQRIAVASAKQCRRAVVPPVNPLITLRAAIENGGSEAKLMFVEPGPDGSGTNIRTVTRPASATLIVGPEGGWSDEELRVAREGGASLVTMGGLTLRADAMPIVALTAVKTLWEDF